MPRGLKSSGSFISCRANSHSTEFLKDIRMADILYIALMLGTFGLCVLAIVMCERL